jgi:hypothetical protein
MRLALLLLLACSREPAPPGTNAAGGEEAGGPGASPPPGIPAENPPGGSALGEPPPGGGAPGGRIATDEATGLSEAAAWDLHLLDLLAAQLDLTRQMTQTVARRTTDSGLRDWATNAAEGSTRYAQEIAALRARWYPSTPAVASIADAPTLDELGPTTEDVAARQGPTARHRPGTAPSAGGRAGSADVATPPRGPRQGESRRLPGGQQVDMGRAGVVDRTPSPATTTHADEVAYVTKALESLHALETGPLDARRVTDIVAPVLQRSISASMVGAMQASHPDIRALAARIQAAEEGSLDRLTKLAEAERG